MFRNPMTSTMLSLLFSPLSTLPGHVHSSIRHMGVTRRQRRRLGKVKRHDPNGLYARTIKAQRGFTTWQLERLRDEWDRAGRVSDWPWFLDSRRDNPPLRSRERASGALVTA